MSMDLEEDYEKIYRYCYMKLHHQQTAEDITQETFLCFLEGCAYKEIGKRLAFLYTIARNKCIDHYRSKTMLELREEEEESKEDTLIVSIDLQRAVSKLSQDEQELIFLRYVNEESINNISQILKISRFSVYRKLQKCLKILETTLGKGEWF